MTSRILIAAALCAALGVSGCVRIGVTAGAMLARTALQERSTDDAILDTEIQLTLNDRFLGHSTDLFADVSTDVTEGRVVLTGTVPTREEKIAATRIAWEVAGVRSVTDELEVAEDSGALAYLEDAWISNRIRVLMLGDAGISSINYSVETVDRVVHLTGIATSRAELRRVLGHATRTPGVARVISHVLTIDDPRRQVVRAASPQSG